MKTRKLGNQGLEVSALGLGCMGMSEFYGSGDEQEAIGTTVSKWINLRSFFTGNWADADARKRVLKVFNQDKPIVESQHPKVVPYDLNEELHVQSDALQVEYRKMCRQFFKN